MNSEYKIINFRVIGILNLSNKKRHKTALFLTSNLTDDILKCKMDAYCEIENKERFFKNIEKKEVINEKYSNKGQSRKGFIFGETIRATINSNGEIIKIDLDNSNNINLEINNLIKDVHISIKYLLDIIMLIKKNRVSISEPIICNASECFSRIRRIIIGITSVNNSKDYFEESYIFRKVKRFYERYDEIEWNGHDLLLDLSIVLRKFINNDKNAINTIREINSILYQFCKYEDYLIEVEELLQEVALYFNVEIEKNLIPKLNGKVINIKQKELKKTSVKAHIRRTKMSIQKREEILCFLEENNIFIDNIGVITKENFETFNWGEMTIVDSFEKNIQCIVLEEDKNLETYIDKELERQNKLDKGNLIHQNLIRQMAYTLLENGIVPKYNRFIDLYCELNKDIYILFEMKSINKDNCYSQLMKAFSQLMVYPYICGIKNNICKCIVLSEEPTEKRFESLFKDNSINVIWLENGIFTTYSWTDTRIMKLLLYQIRL